MKSLTFPAILFFLPTVALAQPAAGDPATIVVTGAGLDLPPGTPAYGSVVIDRQRLQDSASGRIESVLGDVAGFQQFRRSDSRSANPSAQGATLRALGGNASSRTLVLLDGVPMADPFFGYIPFSALVPDRLSVVRVTRGGGIGAFGAGAVAGTIELASATRDQLPGFAASAFYGSRDSTEVSASITPDVGNGYVSLSGRWDRGDGFQTTPRDQRVAATVPAAYDGWSTNLRAVAPISATSEVQFRATLFEDKRTLRFAGADNSSQGQDASIRYIDRGRWQVDALAYVQVRNFSNLVISSSTFRRTLDQRNTPSTGIGGKIELRPPVGDAHVLRVGVDSRFASGDMFEDAYNANSASNPATFRRHAGGQQWTRGIFVEDDWTPAGPDGRLVLTGGVRADRWSISDGFYRQVSATNGVGTSSDYADRSDWEVSGRAGALYRASDAIALRGAAYSGFRLPTLNELYRPFRVGAEVPSANAALKPERLWGGEVGADWDNGDTKLSATLFANHLTNAIANVTLAPNLNQRQNLDAIDSKGVEVSAEQRIGPATLGATYAFTDAKVDASGAALRLDGRRPAQIAKHGGSVSLRSNGSGPFGGFATLRYVGKQNEDDLGLLALGDALTLDAGLSWRFSDAVSIEARGENLFDELVPAAISSSGIVERATPRTLWVGARVSF